MRRIGIIGGLSPESTVSYYNGLNAGVRSRLGGNNNADIDMRSLNFQKFIELKEKGDWDTQARFLSGAAQDLERSGADFIVLATNTMHKMADQISASVSIPFLHIADATADVILAQDIKTIGLLGTKYTMELDFYKGRLEEKGLNVIAPDEKDRETVNNIIYKELCFGLVKDFSRAAYLEIMGKLQAQGAEGIILGCTEIGMLIGEGDADIPLFDTTKIHIDAAIEMVFE